MDREDINIYEAREINQMIIKGEQSDLTDWCDFSVVEKVLDKLEQSIQTLTEEKEEYKKVLYMVEPNLEDALKDAVETILDKWENKNE